MVYRIMMFSSIYLSVALLSAFSNAYVPALPRQTSSAEEAFDPRGVSPRPTGSPLNLFGRQSFPDDAGVALVAPDNTCGYILGLQGAPFSCNSKYKCVFFSATGSGFAPIACCTTGMACKIRTACVASADYFGSSSSSFCGDGCRKDLFTLKCTNSAQPFCAGIRFTSPNVQDYWCDESSAESWRSAASTYPGQQRVFTTVDKAALFGGRTSSPSETPTSTPTPPPNGDSNGSTSPIGAIVGGVIGGLALLAIAGFAIFFIRRRSKKRNGDPQSTQPPHDPYSYHPTPVTAPISEMESHAGDPRQSYMSSSPPNTNAYNSNLHQQYYDPPKPQNPLTQPHLSPETHHLPPQEPQELYTPQPLVEAPNNQILRPTQS